MIKSTLKLLMPCLLLISSASFASPILCDDSPENCLNSNTISSEFYITKDGFDWVWASFVNIQFAYGGLNELKLPTFNGRNWKFAETTAELNALLLLTLADFTRTDGTIIEASKFWNTQIHGVDVDNLNDKDIASVWVANDNDAKFYYDPFYVRTQAAPASIPEPSTLGILCAGLLGFTFGKRTIK